MAHYAASKGGVISLTKALAVELARSGITVNTIPPSLVDTPMARQAEAAGDFPGVDVVGADGPARPGRHARRTSPPPARSSAPTAAATSPARSSASTAACTSEAQPDGTVPRGRTNGRSV